MTAADHVAAVLTGAARRWAGARVSSNDAAAWPGDTTATRNALGAAAGWRAARVLEDAVADEAELVAAYTLAADAGAPAGELRETRALLAEVAARRSAAESALGLDAHLGPACPRPGGLAAAPWPAVATTAGGAR